MTDSSSVVGSTSMRLESFKADKQKIIKIEESWVFSLFTPWNFSSFELLGMYPPIFHIEDHTCNVSLVTIPACACTSPISVHVRLPVQLVFYLSYCLTDFGTSLTPLGPV